MTRDQQIVAVGAASGVAAMVASMALLYRLWPVHSDLDNVAMRLGYALQADLFAVLPLLAGVAVVSSNRFLSEAIDPTLQKEDQTTQINARVLDNTLQQYVLFLVGSLALSVGLTSEQMRFLPAASIVFAAARIAFWIGYRIHPLYRAFGMAATSYLYIALLGFALWKAAMAY